MSDMNTPLFGDENPDVYALKSIYRPSVPGSTGTIVPAVGALIVDVANKGQLYTVESVDKDTHEAQLIPARVLISNGNITDTLASVVSYGNDQFRAYFDTRVQPYRVTIDSRLIIYGTGNANYRLTRLNEETGKTELISSYYHADGSLQGALVPLTNVEADNNNIKYCTNCHTTKAIKDGDKLTLEVYDEFGTLTTTCTVFAKESSILNEVGSNPIIVDMQILSNQSRGNNEIFIYETQEIESLNIRAKLTYDDGFEKIIGIDDLKCKIYGLKNFYSSYPGYRQEIMVKYFLDSEENAKEAYLADRQRVISQTTNLIVIPNKVLPGMKISTVPYWNNSTNSYKLKFYVYDGDHSGVDEVTEHVNIISGEFNGTQYGVLQNLGLQLNLKDIRDIYTDDVFITQGVSIRLRPANLLERYVIKDSPDAQLSYGTDSSSSRRPVIHYDTERQQYFIPSDVFVNRAAVIESFFRKATPLYNENVELKAPEPTHFIIRDIASGNSVVLAPIDLDNYELAFNVTNLGPAGRFVDSTVLVEFLEKIDEDNFRVLYGVPVDIYPSAMGYQGE